MDARTLSIAAGVGETHTRPWLYKWVVLVLTTGLMLSDYATRAVISGVFPLIKGEWGLSDVQLGALVSVQTARETAPTGAGRTGGPPRPTLVSARLKGAENAGYLATRATLERDYRERVALLAPETRARIEQDLALIRSAHEDIRRALDSDPGSRVLLQLLQSTTEQEFDLYSTVGRNTEPLAARTRT